MAKQHTAGYPVTISINGNDCNFIKLEKSHHCLTTTQYLCSESPLGCEIHIRMDHTDAPAPRGRYVSDVVEITFDDVVCKITAD